ncbi:MAG: dienelactone hydrolase family protein [Armatimonadetes bacterium]|nr:dienelactone hydrolase family protein [Armatimonadota bacterium]
MRTPAPDDLIGLQRLRRWLVERLGGPWPRGPASVEIIDSWRRGSHEIRYLRFRGIRGDWVPAYALVPLNVSGPLPTVVALHQHNGQFELGKSEVAGMVGDPSQNIGQRLAEAGFFVLAPDAIAFEERRGRVQQGFFYERFAAMDELLHGRSLTWRMVGDVFCAIDTLAVFPEADVQRVGLIGHSMGGTLTLFAAALDARVKAAVSNCGLASLRSILRDEVIHCYMNYVPGLLPACDHPQIAALIAPRAFLISAGAADRGFPVDGVIETFEYARRTFAAMRVAEKIHLHVESCGHALTEGMHRTAMWWLRRWL